MVRSMCPSSKSVVPYDLGKIVDILSFEDVKTAADFCRMHGIQVDVVSNLVYFSRSMVDDPDELPEVRRAKNVIESKRNCHWSEVINDGIAAENPMMTYRPHDSFDADGYLNVKAFDASDQEQRRAKVTLTPEMKAKFARQQSFDSASHSFVNEIIHEVLDEEVEVVARDALEDEAVEDVFEDLIDEVKEDFFRIILREAKTEELNKRLEFEARMEAAALILEDMIEDIIRNVAKESVEDAKVKEERLKAQMKASSAIVNELLRRTLTEEILSAANSALKEARIEREKALSDFSNKRRMRLLREAFKKWRKIAERKKKLLQILNHFPSQTSSLDLESQVTKLGGKVKGHHHCHYSTQRMFDLIDLKDRMSEMLLREKFDLVRMVAQNYPGNASKIDWKLLIRLPDLYQGHIDEELFVQCVKNKFALGNPHQEENILCLIKDQRIGDRCVSIIVRTVNGRSQFRSDSEIIRGTSAVISIGSNPAMESTNPNPVHCETLDMEPPTNIFENAALIVENLRRAAVNCIKKSKNPAKNPDLVVESVKEMTERMLFRSKLFDEFGKNPDESAAIYNESVEHLVKCVKNEALLSESWPIPELYPRLCGWNSAANLIQVEKTLKNLRLPTMEMMTESPRNYFALITVEGHPNRVQMNAKFGEICKDFELAEFIKFCVEYKISSIGEDLIAGYFKSDLNSFNYFIREKKPPEVNFEVNSGEILEEEKSISGSNLQKLIADEMENSFQFEDKLMEAAAVLSDDLDVTSDCWPTGIHSVSAVSLISPSLARISGTGTARIRFSRKRVFSPTTSGEFEDKKSKISPARRRSRSRSKENKIDLLKAAIDEDLEASLNFEEKLKKALHN